MAEGARDAEEVGLESLGVSDRRRVERVFTEDVIKRNIWHKIALKSTFFSVDLGEKNMFSHEATKNKILSFIQNLFSTKEVKAEVGNWQNLQGWGRYINTSKTTLDKFISEYSLDIKEEDPYPQGGRGIFHYYLTFAKKK